MNNITSNIIIEPGVPTDTTNQLYNDGSNLYFDGNLISLGNADFGFGNAYNTSDEDFFNIATNFTQVTSGGGSSVNFVASEQNHFGVYSLVTGAAAGNYASFHGATNVIERTNWNEIYIKSVIRLDALDSNAFVQVGLANTWTTDVTPNQIKFRFLQSESANWRCITRAAGVQTVTDSLVAATTNWVTLGIYIKATSVEFYIDSILVATNTTNIPGQIGGQQMTYVASVHRNTTSKTIYIDRVLQQIKRS